MKTIYKVSRNIVSGKDEEYRLVKALGEECGAVEVEDEIDLDAYDYSDGFYGKYYLCFTFDSSVNRDLFVLKYEQYQSKMKREES